MAFRWASEDGQPADTDPQARDEGFASTSASPNSRALLLPVEDIFSGCHAYSPIRYLGSGASGFVFLALHVASGREVALKFVEKDRATNKYLRREIMHHRMLNHPHIVKFYEVVLTRNYVAISMEYASGGSLLDLVRENGRLREGLARWIFQQLAIAVDYCHQRGVASRDLKLENTLLQRRSNLPLPLVKIADFGYSKSAEHSPALSRVGSLVYLPPEVVADPHSVYDQFMCDAWACGVILYSMLLGRLPFLRSTAQETIQAIIDLQWQLPSEMGVSSSAQDLLCRLLAPVQQRSSVSQVCQHPWFLNKLADGAADMNQRLMQQAAVPPNAQSQEEIESILAQAAASNQEPVSSSRRTAAGGR